MDNKLIEDMQMYFNAGSTINLEQMDAIYAPEFVNVRMDRAGNCVTITKQQFMDRFRAMQAQAGQLATTDEETEFLDTTTYGDHASILIRRMKEGRPVLYNFVWNVAGERHTLVREFTVEDDISYLVKLIKEAQSA